MLKPLETRLKEIQDLSLGKITDELLVSIPTSFTASWEDYIGESLAANTIVSIGEVKYLVMQNTTAQSHQRPDSEGMLAIYKPYRQEGTYEWLYGEYCEIGYIRTYEDKYYEAIQNPNANIYSPNLVPAIWQEIEAPVVEEPEIYEPEEETLETEEEYNPEI